MPAADVRDGRACGAAAAPQACPRCEEGRGGRFRAVFGLSPGFGAAKGPGQQQGPGAPTCARLTEPGLP
eukprot:2591393-Pyramimonas_sp.AAC.1